MHTEFQDFFVTMVGGNEERFFHEYWRNRTLLTPAALADLRSFYDYSRFLEDYRQFAYHKATLLIAVDEQGNRRMLRPNQDNSVDLALNRGLPIVLQALALPKELPKMPGQWRWFIDLHQFLCAYLLPAFPSFAQSGGPVSAVDIFCASSETSTGGHYDSGDVFYFVLAGEKEWTVELAPDLEMGIQLAAEGSKLDLSPRNECMKICVRPGDCLYVPPYTYHRVCSRGKSLAVSLGMPTFTAWTFLRASLIHVQKQRILYHPLPSFPRTQRELSCAAEDEAGERISCALELLQSAFADSAASMFSPLPQRQGQ